MTPGTKVRTMVSFVDEGIVGPPVGTEGGVLGTYEVLTYPIEVEFPGIVGTTFNYRSDELEVIE